MSRRGFSWRTMLFAPIAIGAATWFVTQVPQDTSVDRPFEIEGAVGETVRLDYADLAVTDVRVAQRIDGEGGAQAGGVFVVVDAVWEAADRTLSIGGAELVDAQERTHAATSRSGCATATTAVPAYGQRITYCFDVVPDALDGAQVRLGRGGDGEDGAFQRRDAVAVVDLGLDRASLEEASADETPLWIDAPAPVVEAGPGGEENA
ncbi:hypothetical protein [Myceligenerans pegani]|uniref:Uncharacterized protein n=1 Tax=Myceligenerans pegani TaxID=2776917 RepID=A0ABR9N4R8_9MICO|nr:hypothetical protein [Myceligenerans sp. TRM 65318]MBE1878667.1 hypothetical protein [Myceligenerans sp. TRM 65318]MBE3020938.1 hypothetical protein [Myceligenerans sp. TRM 65318]